MKNYEVCFEALVSGQVEVEAENQEIAERKVEEELSFGLVSVGECVPIDVDDGDVEVCHVEELEELQEE